MPGDICQQKHSLFLLIAVFVLAAGVHVRFTPLVTGTRTISGHGLWHWGHVQASSKPTVPGIDEHVARLPDYVINNLGSAVCGEDGWRKPFRVHIKVHPVAGRSIPTVHGIIRVGQWLELGSASLRQAHNRPVGVKPGTCFLTRGWEADARNTDPLQMEGGKLDKCSPEVLAHHSLTLKVRAQAYRGAVHAD